MADEPITESETSSGDSDPLAETFDGETNDSAWLDSKVGARGDEWIGSFIGQFEVVRVIGTGGMGNVYEARQTNPHRSVALKIVKSAAASETTLQRFELESEMLARLQHPGIAQVYESGHQVHDGKPLPFFVMEYVAGSKSITDYADEEELDIQGRLDLFSLVCEAVQYGHGRGVIHRDLKPSNLLVSLAGRPKVIDFGVALFSDSEEDETTMTIDGRFVGTLQWASPEQCGDDPHDVDVRTDVYSLGVVLYQLLLKQLPYDLKGVPVFKAPEIIRDTPPVKPRSINAHVPIELEFILLKSLAKDRENRYASVADFSADIQRYISNEPIQAEPPSTISLIRLYARRNSLKFQAGLVAIGAILLGIGGLLWGYIEAEVGQKELQEALKIKNETLLFAQQNAYAARLGTAQVAMSSGSWSMASEQLSTIKEKQRGWEWDYLKAEADQSVLQWGIGDNPTTIQAFHSGDKVVVAAEDGRTLILDEIQGSSEDMYLPSKVLTIALTSDDEEILLGTDDGQIGTLNLSENTLTMKQTGLPAVYCSVILQGNRLLTGHADGSVRLWSSSGSFIKTVAQFDNLVMSLDWDETLQLAGVGLVDGDVYLLSLEEEWQLLIGKHDENIFGVHFANHQFLTSAGGNAVKIWDVEKKEHIASLTSHHGAPVDIAVVGKFLVIAHESGVLTTWSIADQKQVDTLRGHEGMVWGVENLDDQRAASVGKDGKVRWWEIGYPPSTTIQVKSKLPATDIAFIDHEQVAILSHVSSNLQIVNVSTGQSHNIPTPSYEKLTVVEVIDNSGMVVTGDLSGTIRIWDIAKQTAGKSVGTLESEVMSIAVSDDGQFVAAGSVDGTVRVWNLATSDQIFSKIISGSLILDVDFSPNIAMLFISASGKEVSAIELVSGKQVWVSEAIGPDVFAMEINSKNGTLVTATSQGYIQILDIENGDVMATAKSNDGSLRDIAVMPDGNRLMLTTRVGALHVWNLANLGKILSLPVANELDEMAISPDGTRIAICSASPIVHILDSVSRGERIKEQRK